MLREKLKDSSVIIIAPDTITKFLFSRREGVVESGKFVMFSSIRLV